MKRKLLAYAATLVFLLSNNPTFPQKKHTDSSRKLLAMLEQELKNPAYAQETLPNDFTHMINLFMYGKQTKQPVSYARAVLNPFTNLLKSSQYLNSHTFSGFLVQIPELLQQYFIPLKTHSFLSEQSIDVDSFDRFKHAVHIMMYKKFSSDFDSFKQDPDIFLDNLSVQIHDLAQEELDIQHVRHALIRFLDTCLSKLVWSPEEPDNTRKSIKVISENLAQLFEYNIIDDPEDLIYLYRTLVSRYAFFLDIAATDLPTDFYTKLRHDIEYESLLLFELEEKDSFLETKKEFLTRSILHAEAKCRAYEKGIIIS